MTLKSIKSPLHSTRREREPAFAVMSRLAAVGDVSAVDFGHDVGFPFSEILKGKPSTLAEFYKLSGQTENFTSDWTPISHEKSKRQISGHHFPTKPTITTEICGCPDCLREDIENSSLPPHRAMTFRAHWMIHHVKICLRHNRELVPLWKERSQTLRYDTAMQFRSLADIVSAGLFEKAERDPTDFEIWFDQRLAGGAHATTWLDEHSLHAASFFCRLLGMALLKLQNIMPAQVAAESQWACYQMGFEVARHGERAIVEARQKQNRLAEPRTGPKAVFPMLYDRLAHDHIDDPSFNPYREVLSKHIQVNWPLGPGEELLGVQIAKGKLHSVTTAASESGVDSRRLRKMLEKLAN